MFKKSNVYKPMLIFEYYFCFLFSKNYKYCLFMSLKSKSLYKIYTGSYFHGFLEESQKKSYSELYFYKRSQWNLNFYGFYSVYFCILTFFYSNAPFSLVSSISDIFFYILLLLLLLLLFHINEYK